MSSQAHVDDRPLLDLGEPLLESVLVLLAVEDVADLTARLEQRLARKGLLRVEVEQVIADLGPKRGRGVTGLEPKDGLLDLRRELAALERAEATAVLRRRILRVLARESRE